MTLACPLEFPQPTLTESILWSVLLVLPVMGFLFLPRLLPLGRELRFSWARLLLPFARLAGRAEGAAGSWRQRLRSAWLDEVRARHPSGAMAETAADPRLMWRARMVGELARGVVTAIGAMFAVSAIFSTQRYALAWTLAITLGTIVAGWIARVGGEAAAAWAQGAAVAGTWGWPARLAVGTIVGAGWGALTGWAAMFAALWAITPTMSLLTFDTPTGVLTYYVFAVPSIVAAFVGACTGALLVGGVALAARPKRD